VYCAHAIDAADANSGAASSLRFESDYYCVYAVLRLNGKEFLETAFAVDAAHSAKYIEIARHGHAQTLGVTAAVSEKLAKVVAKAART
jgi:hypothetical protein